MRKINTFLLIIMIFPPFLSVTIILSTGPEYYISLLYMKQITFIIAGSHIHQIDKENFYSRVILSYIENLKSNNYSDKLYNNHQLLIDHYIILLLITIYYGYLIKGLHSVT